MHNVQRILVAVGRHCRIVDRMVSAQDDWRRARLEWRGQRSRYWRGSVPCPYGLSASPTSTILTADVGKYSISSSSHAPLCERKQGRRLAIAWTETRARCWVPMSFGTPRMAKSASSAARSAHADALAKVQSTKGRFNRPLAYPCSAITPSVIAAMT